MTYLLYFSIVCRRYRRFNRHRPSSLPPKVKRTLEMSLEYIKTWVLIPHMTYLLYFSIICRRYRRLNRRRPSPLPPEVKGTLEMSLEYIKTGLGFDTSHDIFTVFFYRMPPLPPI